MGHAKANCHGWQESEARGKQPRRLCRRIPAQHLYYWVLPAYACMGLAMVFLKCGFSCNQNPVIEEVERDLQLPCKNTNAEAHVLSSWVCFLCGSGGIWRICGRIMPCSQDQREWMVPRSGAGMDGFPQAGMMCESLGKAVVGFYHRIVQNLFYSPTHWQLGFKGTFFCCQIWAKNL